MSDSSFAVTGLRPGNVIQVHQFNGSNPLSITVVSGVVAHGGSGHILKGETQPSDPLADTPQLVALKVILTFSGNNTDGQRMCRELAAVSHVRHRHILPFIGALSTSMYTILVSDFMDNGDMLKYMAMSPAVERGPLVIARLGGRQQYSCPSAQILQVAIAVDYLHRCAGLVHGDLKCENVLISRDGEALLTDFGFSTTVEKSPREDTTATSIRMSNTPRFAAPELLLDKAKSSTGRTRSKTPQTDVYAFGMLILQAFSGARPWPELNDQAVLLKVAQKVTPPRSAGATAAGLSDAWWGLCRQCWSPKPKRRPSMLNAATRIRSILGVPEPDERTEQDAPSAGVTVTPSPMREAAVTKPNEVGRVFVAPNGLATEHRAKKPNFCSRFRWPWF